MHKYFCPFSIYIHCPSISCGNKNYMKSSSVGFQSETPVVYTGLRGWGHREEWVGVLFYIGEIKNLAFCQTRKF